MPTVFFQLATSSYPSSATTCYLYCTVAFQKVEEGEVLHIYSKRGNAYIYMAFAGFEFIFLR